MSKRLLLIGITAFITMICGSTRSHAQSLATYMNCFAGADQYVSLDVDITCDVVDQNNDNVSVGYIAVTINYNGHVIATCDGYLSNGVAGCKYLSDEGSGNYAMVVQYSGSGNYQPSSFSGPIYIYE